MKTINFFIVTLFVGALLYSCKDDPCATYEGDIKPIIDASCAYSGCHSGSDAGMFVPNSSRDYTNYEGLIQTLESGAFASEVIDSLSMPPFYAQPPNPLELTQAELDLITCWIDEGYPKN